eukprot:2774595-Ditylum_brightwellii.AAC.1
MDTFERMKPSIGTLEQLNNVRLFLQALTLTDLANNAGTHIEPWTLPETRVAKVLMHWPNQERPPEQSWALWQRFLKKAFVPNASKAHRLNKPLPLPAPLGDWTTKQPYTDCKFSFNQESGNIFVYKDNAFHIYRPCQNRVVWFQDTGNTSNKITDSAIRMNATFFESLMI